MICLTQILIQKRRIIQDFSMSEIDLLTQDQTFNGAMFAVMALR